MNLKFSGLIAGAAMVALSSCSVYKSGQTPDDVYFSPGKTTAAAAAKSDEYLETNPKKTYHGNYSESTYRDDQYMRMMISTGRMPYYYNDFAMVDPWMYNNWRWNSYMTWNTGFANPWNSMWYWNSFYNPYCTSFYTYPVKGGNYGYTTIPRPSRPASAFSMSSYLNTNGTNNQSGYRPGKSYTSSYNNSNSTGTSTYSNMDSRRSLFGPNNNSSYERPSRSYTPSSNQSSSGSRSSSGSGGGGVSRPTRTGGN